MEKNLDYSRGERIADFRRKKGMSQIDLADITGISRQSISGIENGADFKVSNLMALVSALEVTPEMILGKRAETSSSLTEKIVEEISGLDDADLKRIHAVIRAIKSVG